MKDKKKKCKHQYKPVHKGFMVLRSMRYKCTKCGKDKIY